MSRLVESYTGDELPPLDFGIPTHVTIKNKPVNIDNLRELFNEWIKETGQCTKSEQTLITNFIEWIEKR
jgi:hypothetical protein